jgi:hypothetical protein
MLRLTIAVLLFAVGCIDTGTVVNVGPSAERHVEEIAVAVDEMNGLLGAAVFSVRMVDSDEMIDGQIIVRHQAGPFRVNALARTNLTRRGIAIYVRDVCDARCVLHELGHAGGLVEHSRDMNNLMFHNERGGSYLTDRQIDRVLARGGRSDD